MYVRWNRVKGRLCAVLVRSARVSGQPRQKVVGYLASIHDAEYFLQHPKYRYEFWVRLCEHLDRFQQYGEIDADTRQAVESRVARTVRPATAADVEEEERELAEEDERELERWRAEMDESL